MHIFKVENLTKEYKVGKGKLRALDNVSLTVEKGDIYGIIGLSGAGKSTLVRCLNLLEEPTSGRVLYQGDDLQDLKRNGSLNRTRRQIGMIFQRFNLFQQKSVFQNVMYPLRLAKVPKDEATVRVRRVLKLVGLEDKEKVYPSQLSGGQQQRVAIARALVTNPEVILCDEATSALDPQTTQSILQLLKHLNEVMEITIVIITHEMSVVESICNKVAVIDEAHIVESGPVSDVFVNPQSAMGKLLVRRGNKNQKMSERCWRLLFDENSTDEAVISELSTECNTKVNVLRADLIRKDKATVGYMDIQLPEDEEAIKRIKTFLDKRGIKGGDISYD